MGQIDVTNLNRKAIEYDAVLRKLPFLNLKEELSKLGINQVGVDGENILAQFRRKTGSSRPYKSDAIGAGTKVGDVIERILKAERSYVSYNDSILNYEAYRVMSNTMEPVDEKTKRHPLEMLIIESVLKNVSDDILTSLFLGEYDTTDQTPAGMYDGFYTKIASDIADGEISAAKKNLITTGAFVDPTTGTTAFYQLVDFLMELNPLLRYSGGTLYITEITKNFAKKALTNKYSSAQIIKEVDFLDALRDAAGMPNLNIFSHPAMGTGSKLMFCANGILDFGMDTSGGSQFVQVRQLDADPNIINFWSQWKAGTRIRSVDKKEFACNEQVNISPFDFGDIAS